MIDKTVKGVNPEIDKLSKEIIAQNKHEFVCMRLGKDPKIPATPKWINTEEALQIYRNLLDIGGAFRITNMQDFEYALTQPRMNTGAPRKTEFMMICECAYNLYRCVSETVAAQYSATIFILLCELNKISIKFEIGDISDIFSKLKMNSIEYWEFEKLLWGHIEVK